MPREKPLMRSSSLDRIPVRKSVTRPNAPDLTTACCGRSPGLTSKVEMAAKLNRTSEDSDS